MDTSNKLKEGYLYFFEHNGIFAIGEYMDVDLEHEDYDEFGRTKFISEMWNSLDDGNYRTYVNGKADSVNVIKELGDAFDPQMITEIVAELREEFPEYFI